MSGLTNQGRPIIRLIKEGRVDDFKLLLQHGQNPNEFVRSESPDVSWDWHLMCEVLENAPEGQRLHMVRLLLEHGADPGQRYEAHDEQGPAAWSHSASLPSMPLGKALIEGYIPELRAMLETEKVSLFTAKPDGQTVLHELMSFPFKKDSPSSFERLEVIQDHFERIDSQRYPDIDTGHLWNMRNFDGKTPLMLALWSQDMLQWAISHPNIRADRWIEECDNDGRTMLFQAAHKGYLNATRLLIGVGADIEPKDKNGVRLIDHLRMEDRMDVTTTIHSSSKTAVRREVIEILSAAKSAKEAGSAIDLVMAEVLKTQSQGFSFFSQRPRSL